MVGLIGMISPILSSAQNITPVSADKNPNANKTVTLPTHISKEVADFCKKPELKNGGDSIAYMYGAYQIAGLKEYIVHQLGVDTAYINDFYKGLMSNVSSLDKKTLATNAGIAVGNQIKLMSENLTKEYYETEPDKHIDASIVARSLIAALCQRNEYKQSPKAEQDYKKALNAKKEANNAIKFADNRIAGEKFLEENKKKEGVQLLPSGLQYKVLTKGDGVIPKATDRVKVNYEGHLIDGTEFDSSYKRKKPSSFRCDQVIKGWTEALTHMPVGSKWEIYIPQELGYASHNTGKILPYSALIFTVELLEIEQPETKPTTKSR